MSLSLQSCTWSNAEEMHYIVRKKHGLEGLDVITLKDMICQKKSRASHMKNYSALPLKNETQPIIGLRIITHMLLKVVDGGSLVHPLRTIPLYLKVYVAERQAVCPPPFPHTQPLVGREPRSACTYSHSKSWRWRNTPVTVSKQLLKQSCTHTASPSVRALSLCLFPTVAPGSTL